MSEPLKVECPHCWAAKGEPCYAGLHRSNHVKPHAARVRAAEHDERVLTTERNAALLLAEQRGAAYDMAWREVESLRERLDKEEEERGRQFGLRCQAEAEVERLMSLVKEWLDGNARLGRPKSIADQRFLNGLNAAVGPKFTHWSGTATKPEEP